jgi:Lipocalin-like domain
MEQIGMIGRLLLLLLFCFSAADAFGQTAKELVGSWTLISVTVNRDGEKIEPFGPNPKGTMTFDSGGRFSIIVTRSDLPKFASNNRETATSEENKAVVQGSIAYARGDDHRCSRNAGGDAGVRPGLPHQVKRLQEASGCVWGGQEVDPAELVSAGAKCAVTTRCGPLE